MALSIHGLCLIAEAEIKEVHYQYRSVLKFEVASDDGNGKSQRHYIQLFVNKDQIEEIKTKLIPGTVCEITHGSWSEYKPGNQEDKGRITYSKVELKVDIKNFKFLKPCIFYAEIEGITKGEPNVRNG